MLTAADPVADLRAATVALEAASAGWDVTLVGRSGAAEHGPVGPGGELASRLGEVAVLRWPWPAPLPRVRARPVAAPDDAEAPHDRLELARRRHAAATGAARPLRAAGLGAARLRSTTRAALHGLLDESPEPTRTSTRRLLHEAGRLDALELDWGRRLEAVAADADVVWVVGDQPLGAALTLRGRPGRRLVYDLRTDLSRSEASVRRRVRTPVAGLRARRERQLAARADLLVAGTPEAAVLARLRHPGVTVLEVPEHLPAAAPDLPPAPALTALAARSEGPHRALVVTDPVVGHAAHDLELLLPVLAERPDLHLVVLTGARGAGRRSLRNAASLAGVRERVHWVDEAPDGWLTTSLTGAALGVVLAGDAAEAPVQLPSSYLRLRRDGVPVLVQATPPLSAAVRADASGTLVRLDDDDSGDSDADGGTDERATADLAAAVDDLLRHRDRLAARPRQDPSAPGRAALLEALGEPPPPGEAVTTTTTAEATAPREDRVSPVARTLGVGPANFAGQGWAWAKAAERALPGLTTEVFARAQGTLTFPSDRTLDLQRLATLQGRLDEARYLLETFSHVLAEANRPLLAGLLSDDAAADLALLQRGGVRVAVALHGSEVRDPVRNAELERWSPFRGTSPEAVAFREWSAGLVERTTAMLAGFSGPVFVSTPDLLLDVPTAHWLPVVVDLDRPQGVPPLSRDGLPVVVHAPSKAVGKGTSMVEPVLYALEEEGVLRYQPVRGVPPEQMPTVLAEADLVLDQFGVGSYGVLACEAMAAGRLVVGHVSDRVRGIVTEQVGEELPMVQATPDDLAEVLRAVLGDRDAARVTSERSRAFVQRVHDGTRSGELLRDVFLTRE